LSTITQDIINLLQTDRFSTSQIAKKLDCPRGTISGICFKLKKRGVIEVAYHDYTRFGRPYEVYKATPQFCEDYNKEEKS